ncbi:MAG: AAA family ATPase [Planctomycetes bacterium]|nr:AAA family ATPase [Planctomycetota bacterium]
MGQSTITRVRLKNFTAFKELDIKFGLGINAFIGTNGTGKTHLLKSVYSACDFARGNGSFTGKLIRVFLPFQSRIGRLVFRQRGRNSAVLEIYRGLKRIKISFSNISKTSAKVLGKDRWTTDRIQCAYIPVKEMLANSPGFRSLYSDREIHFEEIYVDIIDKALKPLLRGPPDISRKELLKIIEKSIEGKIVLTDEEFFLNNRQGRLEFTLLAEGMRKLGLLWLLIQNGTLLKGSILFWDEPETNLNPKLMGTVVDILLKLQLLGVQIFIATHDYVLLKEFDLRKTAKNKIMYHSLYRDPKNKEIMHSFTNDFVSIEPNAISDTFMDLYDRDVERALELNTRKNK